MSRDEPGPRDEAEERAEAEAPEEFWRRRDFLARTAAVAGVAGLASILPPDTLMSLAAKRRCTWTSGVHTQRLPADDNAG